MISQCVDDRLFYHFTSIYLTLKGCHRYRIGTHKFRRVRIGKNKIICNLKSIRVLYCKSLHNILKKQRWNDMANIGMVNQFAIL